MTAPIRKTDSPAEVLKQACAPGRGVIQAKGTVWLKVQSKEATGRFPATVVASQAGKLDLEVTNLVGGTEARIRVRRSRYTVEVPGKKSQRWKGSGTWGGIPLQWATDLFLGRIPCPDLGGVADYQFEVHGEDQLTVEVPGGVKAPPQKFAYTFTVNNGEPWVENLHWESLGPQKTSVDFEFSKPEDHTLSPLGWQATSEKGEVRAKWRNRDYALDQDS